jgi:7-cyano-7-deazaguanine synthase
LKEAPRAVVLVSGGLDSCVAAAMAAADYQMAFLHANYGQRTESKELRAFHDLAEHWNVADRFVVNFDALRRMGGSSLTDRNIPVAEADLSATAIPTSYVPFRNAHLLAAAVSWAEVIGAVRVFIGAVEEDSSGYPDCRPAFYHAFNRVIELGTRPSTHIRIETPIIQLLKRDIIQRGHALNAPFELTWSCYQSDETACGVCDSCALRLRGFQEAGLEDPIPYAKRPDYRRPAGGGRDGEREPLDG